MTAEKQPGGEPAGEAMTRPFMFPDQEDRQLPPGVDPSQLNFLREADSVGAFSRVRPQTARIIAAYYTTPATYADLAKQYGITAPTVRERITRGVAQMRRVLYQERPELAEEDKYPLEQIKKGKDNIVVSRSDRSRTRRSDAQVNRSLTQADEGINIFNIKPAHSE